VDGIQRTRFRPACDTYRRVSFARCLSALKEERVAASKVLTGPATSPVESDRATFIENVRCALYCSKIVPMRRLYAAQGRGQGECWNLNMGASPSCGARMHHSKPLPGRSGGLRQESCDRQSLFDSFFSSALTSIRVPGARRCHAVELGVPTPAFSTALNFFGRLSHRGLPANLLQAQRDYFGAHTYERIDQPRGQFFHTTGLVAVAECHRPLITLEHLPGTVFMLVPPGSMGRA